MEIYRDKCRSEPSGGRLAAEEKQEAEHADHKLQHDDDDSEDDDEQRRGQ